jgi:hypothetical protein
MVVETNFDWHWARLPGRAAIDNWLMWSSPSTLACFCSHEAQARQRSTGVCRTSLSVAVICLARSPQPHLGHPDRGIFLWHPSNSELSTDVLCLIRKSHGTSTTVMPGKTTLTCEMKRKTRMSTCSEWRSTSWKALATAGADQNHKPTITAWHLPTVPVSRVPGSA